MPKTVCLAAMATAMLLGACGPQHQAEEVVENFMQANIAHPEQLRHIDFSPIDSTHRIGDSLIHAMRQATSQHALYKQGIEYEQPQPGDKLIILRANYWMDSIEHSSTFYLDATLSGVVAVKVNHAGQ